MEICLGVVFMLKISENLPKCKPFRTSRKLTLTLCMPNYVICIYAMTPLALKSPLMTRKLDRGLRGVWELSIVNVLRSADCNQSGFNESQQRAN